jgi:hypothetical protein
MKITFRAHAVRRMFERSVSTDEVHAVLAMGETIADYPDDTPYPSRLVLGWRGDRPLHVVAAYNGTDDETIVVTVYQPAAADWEPDFRRKKG